MTTELQLKSTKVPALPKIFSLFSQLPAEIREQIYRYYFSEGLVAVNSYGVSGKLITYAAVNKHLDSPKRWSDRKQQTQSKIVQAVKYGSESGIAWDLLNDCFAQLAREVSLPAGCFKIALQETALYFGLIDDLTNFLEFWSHRGPYYLQPTHMPLKYISQLQLVMKYSRKWSTSLLDWQRCLSELTGLKVLSVLFPDGQYAFNFPEFSPKLWYLKTLCAVDGLRRFTLVIESPGEALGRGRWPHFFHFWALEYVLRRHCQYKIDGVDVHQVRLDTSGSLEKLQTLIFREMNSWMTENAALCSDEASRKAEIRRQMKTQDQGEFTNSRERHYWKADFRKELEEVACRFSLG